MESADRELFDPQRAGRSVLRLLDGATSATLIAPFITVSGLLPLLDVVDLSADIVVYTRWIPSEIAAGVSDPAIFQLIDGRGGKVFLEPRLHAKAYLAGASALIGSANLTGKALGFGNEANLEILQRVDLPSRSISALITTLTKTAAPATSDTANRLIVAAQSAPPVLQAAVPRRDPWLPRHSVPHHVCAAYLDSAVPVATELLTEDLAAIAAPPGLSHTQFVDHVAGLLLQGLPGRIVSECRGVPTYVGVQRLVELTAEAGVNLPSDPQERYTAWVKLVEWFAHFLGATKTDGGRAFA